MLSEDLIYEISVFLSPTDLIKLSLCSRGLRRAIMIDQRIWRFHYYKEWPAFLISRNPTEDALFPAPTWIQTYFMRKMSELNIERQQMKEISRHFDYVFYKDLALHYDRSEEKLHVYKNIHRKILEYNVSSDFYIHDAKVCSGGNLIISYSGCDQEYLHCFSKSGEHTQLNADIVNTLFPIDENRFVGTHDTYNRIFKVTPNNRIQQEDLDFLGNSIVKQIYRKPGYLAAISPGADEKSFVWKIWNLRKSQPEIAMEKIYTTEHEITVFGSRLLAERNFIFIPFKSEKYVYVYVYSFKEDRFRVFEISDAEHSVIPILFYASNCIGVAFYEFTSYSAPVICICFSGTVLDSLSLHTSVFKNSVTKYVQISKNLLFNSDKFSCKVINMHSGQVIWQKHVRIDPYKVNINSRYLVFNKKMYDFSPEKPPEIEDWLYKLFK